MMEFSNEQSWGRGKLVLVRSPKCALCTKPSLVVSVLPPRLEFLVRKAVAKKHASHQDHGNTSVAPFRHGDVLL